MTSYERDGVSNHRRLDENFKAPCRWPFLRGIYRWPVNSPHKGRVMRKCFHLVTSSWVGPTLGPPTLLPGIPFFLYRTVNTHRCNSQKTPHSLLPTNYGLYFTGSPWLFGVFSDWCSHLCKLMSLGDVEIFLKLSFSNPFFKYISWENTMKLLTGECHRFHLEINQHFNVGEQASHYLSQCCARST